MEEGKSIHLPRRSLHYLLVCGGGVLVFLLLGIFPSQMKLRDLDLQIAEIKTRIEEQKALFPVFQDLLRRERKLYELGILLPAERAKLGQDQIGGVSGTLAKAAEVCNLEKLHVTTDLKSLEADVKTLRVRASARGDFLQFRCFLLELNRLPYLHSIDEVRVVQQSEEEEIHLTLSLDLAD